MNCCPYIYLCVYRSTNSVEYEHFFSRSDHKGPETMQIIVITRNQDTSKTHSLFPGKLFLCSTLNEVMGVNRILYSYYTFFYWLCVVKNSIVLLVWYDNNTANTNTVFFLDIVIYAQCNSDLTCTQNISYNIS